MSIDLSPADTGEITREIGENTQVIQPFEPGTILARRPLATGEYQIIAPAAPDLDGEDGSVRRSVPYTLPEGWAWDGPRHRRRTGLLRRLFGGAR